MKLYLVRHGESETNKSGSFTGWLDVALTEKGRGDAEEAARLIKEVNFDKVYSSDLKRALETARIALPGHEYETTSLLREIRLGSLEGQPLTAITDENRARIPTEGYAMYGGESNEEFKKRVTDFLKTVETAEAENVIAFSHAGFVRAVLDEVVGVRLSRGAVKCANCTVAVFEFIGGKWSLHSWINV